ncbi:hypothetical protein TB2_020711 [Malus domestica]
MSETLPSPLLLGTDGQKGRAPEMVMKSPARDYRSCCDDGCRSWQSWSCRQRRSGEENRGGRRQANLTRTQPSLLQLSPTIRSSIHSLNSVTEEDVAAANENHQVFIASTLVPSLQL